MSRSLRALWLTAAASLIATLLVVLAGGRARAVMTERFVLDDAEVLSAGDLVATAVHSDGRVTLGVETRRIAMPDDVPLIYSAVRAQDGAIYLGTGNDGRIYRARGDQVTLFAETRQLLVSALAIGDGGTLYAGTLPEGRIYAIGADGQPRELARPDNVEHVWALVWDARRRVLFAGTGPDGRVYAIDPRGQATLWWDAPYQHVMSLALAQDGTLYAGTTEEAVVARLTAPTRAEIVYDFPGNEITAIAERDGALAVAANEFPDPPAVISAAPMPSSTGTPMRAPRPRPGKGRVWHLSREGRAERVHAQEDGHFTSLELRADGTIYAAAGNNGRVVRINPDRTSAVWIDVDERQVMHIALEGSDPYFVTADGAALYRVSGTRPAAATWQSKVLDARFASRWGQLEWRGSGQVILQTRSGNTERPDATWSEWSGELNRAGPIRSPAARFLQLRARFDRDPNATLHAVTAYFLPQNQRATVSGVLVKQASETATKQARAERQSFVPDPSSTLRLTWSADNPDGDRLRYRLRYRQEGQSVWREMTRETDILTATEYAWATASIPDGWYVVRVEASDELENPSAYALRATADSEPLRVDNHAPRVEGLRFATAHLTGRAVDALGPIARLEHAIDGGEWQPLYSTDDLLDTADEAFDLDLSSLAAGDHIVAVRATDASGNVGSAEAQIRR